MRQFKVVPTNDIMDKVYNKYVFKPTVNKSNNSFYKCKKWQSNRFKGDLTERDVDLIKMLAYYGEKNTHIAKLFGISRQAVCKIKNGEIFSKYVSCFEVVERGIYKYVDPTKMEEFKIMNKDVFDRLGEIK